MDSLPRQTLAQILNLTLGAIAERPGLAIALLEPVNQALVAGVPDTPSFREKVAVALGFALPDQPNTVAGDKTRALSIAPGQWLVTSDEPAMGTLTVRLGEALYLGGGFVSCQRDGLVVFELKGPAARDILAMGCALDTEGEALAPGRCARTPFAGVNTILYPLGSRDHWRLHIERAFARQMVEWLRLAASAIG